MKKQWKALKNIFKLKSFSKLRNKKNIFLGIDKIIMADLPVEVVGNNWIDETNKPIAILIGFNHWKKPIFSNLFKEYRCCYTRKFFSWISIYKKFLLPSEVQEVAIVTWGAKKIPLQIRVWQYFFHGKIKINHIQVEDGFIRTIGKGLLHTSPGSICFDSKGIYFNAHKESELECIIKSTCLTEGTHEYNRASVCLDVFRKSRMTKYFDVSIQSDIERVSLGENYSILVIGQVEDDASIKYGKSKLRYNTELVEKARKEYPNADIYYKPHPDYEFGNRRQKSKLSKISNISAIVPGDILLSELIQKVDHVYVMTSLTGLEALFYGKKVTVYGAPFYSGWGLTNDKVTLPRRGIKKSVEELFYATYLQYPKYFHLENQEEITFEQQIGYFLVEVLSCKKIQQLRDDPFYHEIRDIDCYLSKPFEILTILVDRENVSTDELFGIIADDLRLCDFGQISQLLVKTSNYDCLQRYANAMLSVLNNSLVDASNKQLAVFFETMKYVLSNTNGRILNDQPDLSALIYERKSSTDFFCDFLVSYIDCCLSTLNYESVENIFDLILPEGKQNQFHPYKSISQLISSNLDFQLKHALVKSIILKLHLKPTRSERDYLFRYRLQQKLKQKFLLTSPIDDLLLKKAAYNALIRNKQDLSIILMDSSWDGLIISNRMELVEWGKIIHFAIKNDLYHLDVNDTTLLKLKKVNYNLYFKLKLSILKKSKNIDYYRTLLQSFKENPDDAYIQSVYANELKSSGEFEAAIQINKLLLSKHTKSLSKKHAINDELQKNIFSIESSYILSCIPQPAIPKGVIFIASQRCFNSLAMIIPALIQAKQKGYAVVHLTAGMLKSMPTGFEYIDRFEGIIPSDMVDNYNINKLSNSWQVDWDSKVIKSGSINFYQAFYERLSCDIRSYYVDIKNKYVFDKFEGQLLRSDMALDACNKIYEELVLKHNINVTFITSNSHVTPYAIFRDFARAKNDRRMGFINCNVAYESYFSNLGSKYSSTMCVTDMTLYPNMRSPFFARREQFELWYENNKDNTSYLERADSLINLNRTHSQSDDKQNELIERLKKWKEEGYSIICAFGKVPVDLNVPYDGGPAHVDKVILLIKPHPHELKPEIALDLIEGFNDLVTVPYQNNVLKLGHRDINVHALASYLDLAILYNGSSSLELTAMGVPVMMAAYFGKHDYPVDLLYPESRTQYEKFILNKHYRLPSTELRKRAAFLICYMGTDEISIKNDYSIRQLTNDKVGIPQWRFDRINELLANGDPAMDLIANRIVEKFEKINHDLVIENSKPVQLDKFYKEPSKIA